MLVNIPDSYLQTLTAQARVRGVALEDYISSVLGQVKEKIEISQTSQVTLDDKANLTRYVLEYAFTHYPLERIGIAWTGGKDSTFILYFVKELVKKLKIDYPPIVFIDEGSLFEEMIEHTQTVAKEWGFTFTTVRNNDILRKTKKVGDEVAVTDLNERNKAELKRIGYKDKNFVFEPESFFGNHLMKTVVQNEFIEKLKIEALVTGIRWDEQEARSHESYVSPRGDDWTPRHDRIHPILHFTERDIWDFTLKYKIPYCSLYADGYRSLGAKGTSKKLSEKPAWEQDMIAIKERAGRNKGKEEVMRRLRDLGYM